MSETRRDELAGTGDPVLSRREGSTQILTLNRPDRLNAVNLAMYERLLAELRAAGEDRDVRCIVLTGQGRAFCVGADLKAHGAASLSPNDRRRYVRTAQRVNHRIQTMGTPVIAAVNGHAIGGGLEMALSCDFMIVSDDAKLRFPEVSLGTFAGGGVVYTLAERVGTAKARELLYLGDFFSGREAVAMGVANWSHPPDRVLAESLQLADRLAEKAPLSLARAKKLIGPAGPLHRRRMLEREALALEEIMGTRDWREGVEAFAEKRTPDFSGE